MQNADPDFSAEIVADLYQYRFKSFPLAIALGALGGIFGAHRFYLGKTLTGILMLLTGGGGLIWWILDLFRIRTMIEVFNKEEDTRADNQQPPQGLGFLPPKHELKLSGPPAWADKRRGRIQVIGSAFVLSLIGLTMGVISGATGIYEPVVITLVFIAITLTVARWKGVSKIPLLSGLSRWNHRLRLYYHTVDPGSVWLLALRPITGVLFAPWQLRARAEVRLYLQLGVGVFNTVCLIGYRGGVRVRIFGGRSRHHARRVYSNTCVHLRFCRSGWRAPDNPAPAVSTRPGGVDLECLNGPVHLPRSVGGWRGLAREWPGQLP